MRKSFGIGSRSSRVGASMSEGNQVTVALALESLLYVRKAGTQASLSQTYFLLGTAIGLTPEHETDLLILPTPISLITHAPTRTPAARHRQGVVMSGHEHGRKS